MRYPATFVSTCLALLTLACAGGGAVTPRNAADAGRRDASSADAAALPCDPPCVSGEMCDMGSCVPATDGDGDGIDGDVDCDDTNPDIGRVAERDCSGSCGAGVERCVDGSWAACTAPTTCDCEPGSPARMVPCMRCGMQRQVCTGGRWTDEGTCSAGDCSPGEVDMGGICGNCGAERRLCGMDCRWGAWLCEGEGVCRSGETQMESAMCGSCGTGTQTRTRTCGATCAWGAWSAFGACSGGGSGECTPGMTDTQTEACGNCMTGRRTRTRTCDAATCAWGAYGAWSACSGGGICAPGATRTGCDPCGVEVCSATCSWGSCQPSVAGGCLRIRPGTSGPPGNNYRCCTSPPPAGDANGIGWQFCLPSCSWSTACEATTSC